MTMQSWTIEANPSDAKIQRANIRRASLAKKREEYARRQAMHQPTAHNAAALPAASLKRMPMVHSMPSSGNGPRHASVKPHRAARAAVRTRLAQGVLEAATDMPTISMGRPAGSNCSSTTSSPLRKPSISPALSACCPSAGALESVLSEDIFLLDGGCMRDVVHRTCTDTTASSDGDCIANGDDDSCVDDNPTTLSKGTPCAQMTGHLAPVLTTGELACKQQQQQQQQRRPQQEQLWSHGVQRSCAQQQQQTGEQPQSAPEEVSREAERQAEVEDKIHSWVMEVHPDDAKRQRATDRQKALAAKRAEYTRRQEQRLSEGGPCSRKAAADVKGLRRAASVKFHRAARAIVRTRLAQGCVEVNSDMPILSMGTASKKPSFSPVLTSCRQATPVERAIDRWFMATTAMVLMSQAECQHWATLSSALQYKAEDEQEPLPTAPKGEQQRQLPPQPTPDDVKSVSAKRAEQEAELVDTTQLRACEADPRDSKLQRAHDRRRSLAIKRAEYARRQAQQGSAPVAGVGGAAADGKCRRSTVPRHAAVKPHRAARAAMRTRLAQGAMEVAADLPSISLGSVSKKPCISPMLGCFRQSTALARALTSELQATTAVVPMSQAECQHWATLASALQCQAEDEQKPLLAAAQGEQQFELSTQPTPEAVQSVAAKRAEHEAELVDMMQQWAYEADPRDSKLQRAHDRRRSLAIKGAEYARRQEQRGSAPAATDGKGRRSTVPRHAAVKPHRAARAAMRTRLAQGAMEVAADVPSISLGSVSKKPSISPMLGCWRQSTAFEKAVAIELQAACANLPEYRQWLEAGQQAGEAEVACYFAGAADACDEDKATEDKDVARHWADEAGAKLQRAQHRQRHLAIKRAQYTRQQTEKAERRIAGAGRGAAPAMQKRGSAVARPRHDVKPSGAVRAALRTFLVQGAMEVSSDVPAISWGSTRLLAPWRCTAAAERAADQHVQAARALSMVDPSEVLRSTHFFANPININGLHLSSCDGDDDIGDKLASADNVCAPPAAAPREREASAPQQTEEEAEPACHFARAAGACDDEDEATASALNQVPVTDIDEDAAQDGADEASAPLQTEEEAEPACHFAGAAGACDDEDEATASALNQVPVTENDEEVAQHGAVEEEAFVRRLTQTDVQSAIATVREETRIAMEEKIKKVEAQCKADLEAARQRAQQARVSLKRQAVAEAVAICRRAEVVAEQRFGATVVTAEEKPSVAEAAQQESTTAATSGAVTLKVAKHMARQHSKQVCQQSARDQRQQKEQERELRAAREKAAAELQRARSLAAEDKAAAAALRARLLEEARLEAAGEAAAIRERAQTDVARIRADAVEEAAALLGRAKAPADMVSSETMQAAQSDLCAAEDVESVMSEELVPASNYGSDWEVLAGEEEDEDAAGSEWEMLA